MRVLPFILRCPKSAKQSISSPVTVTPGYELEALSAWVWEVALSGRVVETLGIRPALLTSMKRMSGEEVVVLSQHESSGSSGNEG